MNCPRCGADEKSGTGFVKVGRRRTTKGWVQCYFCKDCGYKFSETSLANFGRPWRMSHEMIIFAADLFLRGHSSREIARRIELRFGKKVCFNTVLKAMQRFGIQKPTKEECYTEENLAAALKLVDRQLDYCSGRLGRLRLERDKVLAERNRVLQGFAARIDRIDRRIAVAEESNRAGERHKRRLEAIEPRPADFLKRKARRMRKKIIQQSRGA